MRNVAIFSILFLALLFPTGAEERAVGKDIMVMVDPSRLPEAAVMEFRAGDVVFHLEPFFEEGQRTGKSWFIAEPDGRSDLSAWDLAYRLVEGHAEITYAEPREVAIREEEPPAREDGNCEEESYDNEWPHPSTFVFAWHLDDQHSQLRSARQAVSPGVKGIRIAHIDTGYDPQHIALPIYFNTKLQRNYIEGENPNSAVDLGSEGLLKQPGHGTSTGAILAGNKIRRPGQFDDYLGGAPFAEIVPIRLSKTVILFELSAFAKALYYVTDPQVDCKVVSMSMGGVASEFWAQAVNDAYDKGLVIVTAAGNNFGGLPTRNVVYPARFNRVIAACGAAYDKTPYYKEWSFKMQGNFGPSNAMATAVAAYTPNMAWAKMNCVDKIDHDGGGTSAATPQIAAAAALWLQKYQSFRYDYPWQRVNAVHRALFSSADKSYKESAKFYGHGILRAAEALKVAPFKDSKPLPKDEVSFPILTLLFGWRETPTAVQKMCQVEMLQLAHNSRALQQVCDEIEASQGATAEQKARFKAAVIEMPESSETIRNLVRQIE